MKDGLWTAAVALALLQAAPGFAATLTTLVNFGDNWSRVDGFNPFGSLIADASGTLYGTTAHGGSDETFWSSYDQGTVFSLTSGGTLTTLVTFDGSNGAQPRGSLIADADGTLYGTTTGHRDSNRGTVFSLTKSGTLTTLVSFDGVNGRNPVGSLIADASGTLYGTTSRGGSSDLGTVFSLKSDGLLTTLVSFDGTNGANPDDSLTADASGTFYGTTSLGGASNMGTVFSLTTSGTLTTLASFNEANGAAPQGPLIVDAAGTLFGTTTGGGASNRGTVFSLTKSGTLTTLVNFKESTDGFAPHGGLIADAKGSLYGTTLGITDFGSGVAGTVFRLRGAGFDVGPRVVPEPATWAMMILGFGLVGTAARRRRVAAA